MFGHSILRNSGPSACTPGKVRGIFLQSLQPSVMAYVSAINAAQVAQDKGFDSQSTRGASTSFNLPSGIPMKIYEDSKWIELRL